MVEQRATPLAERPRPIPVAVPEGWEVAEASGPGPFITRATLVRPDGGRVAWSSRRHRKRLGLRRLAGPGPVAGVGRPSPSSLAIGALFGLGSICFAAGSLPAYADRVAASTVAWTFFVGSIAFTSAAYLQFRESLIAPLGPEDQAAVPVGFRRLVAWAPHRLDWWIAVVQLAGTVAFNVSTLAAAAARLTVTQERRWIWAPDAVGSICFLLASWGAFVEARADVRPGGHRPVGWWIGVVNQAGSVAFGASAVAARYVRSTGEIANVSVVNLATFLGAACFLGGAVLLPVESVRDAEVPEAAALDG